MNTPTRPGELAGAAAASGSARGVVGAAFAREWTSHRLNRFLHAHVLLVLVAGCLVAITPGAAGGAAWWILYAVLYAVSLSALLLGLSSAHAEADEFVWLVRQPAGPGPWLWGKAAALVSLVGASALVLGLPAWLGGAGSRALAGAVAGAAAVTVVCALVGLAVGFWIRDAVRGLIAAVGAWLMLLFGTDLLLLALAGAPFLQAHPALWVAPLMANPLDAFRVTVLFGIERTAFSATDASSLAGWWTAHAPLWLAVLTATWAAGAAGLAWLGARRPLDA